MVDFKKKKKQLQPTAVVRLLDYQDSSVCVDTIALEDRKGALSVSSVQRGVSMRVRAVIGR